MKSEILRQIEKNKEAYYHKLSSLENDSNIISTEIVQPDLPGTNGFLDAIRSTVKKYSFQIPISKIAVNKKIKNKVGRVFNNRFAKLGSVGIKFNKYLTSKTNKVIDRFYQFGANVFDVNEVQGNQMDLQPDTISVNDISSPMVITVPAIPFFETLQKFIRDVIIYFESDNFNFSRIKPTSISNKIKKQEYQSYCQKKGYAPFAFVNKLIKNKTHRRITEKFESINDSIKPTIHRWINKISFPVVYKFRNSVIQYANQSFYKMRSSLFKPESKIQI